MPRIFGHDDFYGELTVRRTVPGFTLAHRFADCPADAVETHTHREAHFILVTSGEYITSARGNSRAALPLIYNPPGTTHRDHFRNGAGSFFSISVATDQNGPRVDGIARPPSFVEESRTKALAHALLCETVSRPRSRDIHLGFLAYELIDSLHVPIRQGHGKRPPGWLRRVHEKLEDGDAEGLTVRDLASAADVHPVHLARTFRAFFHCTPNQFIQMRRLERTAVLLLFSSVRLPDIAVACGFADQSHMTRSFRRVYGLAPGQFRKTASRHGPAAGSHVSFLQDIRARLRAQSLA